MHLFAFSFPDMTLAGVIGWIIAGLALGKILFWDDRKLKALQREATDISAALSAWGFTLLPKILTDVAILDFVALLADCRNAAKVMGNPTSAAAELGDVLTKMVAHQLSNSATAQSFFDSVYNAAKAKGLKPTTP